MKRLLVCICFITLAGCHKEPEYKYGDKAVLHIDGFHGSVEVRLTDFTNMGFGDHYYNGVTEDGRIFVCIPPCDLKPLPKPEIEEMPE